MLLFTSLQAQISDTVIVTKEITETERLVDKYGGQIVNKFNDIVSAATPIAKEGFDMAVKLKTAEGFVNLLPFIFFIIFGYLLYAEYKRIETELKVPKEERNSMYDYSYGPMDEDNITLLLVLYIISTCILFVLSIFTLPTAILYIIAPEWYAITEIIDLLK